MNFPERVLDEKFSKDCYEFDKKYFLEQKLKSYKLLTSLLYKKLLECDGDPIRMSECFISTFTAYLQTLIDGKMVSKDERDTILEVSRVLDSINQRPMTPQLSSLILGIMTDFFGR
ncbi:hypothetical protein [Candidatus Nitrosocosmicus franklandus]|nr:hypothetical protein [Candidatus Nitrosocosmicus franklandus]